MSAPHGSVIIVFAFQIFTCSFLSFIFFLLCMSGFPSAHVIALIEGKLRVKNEWPFFSAFNSLKSCITNEILNPEYSPQSCNFIPKKVCAFFK